MGVWRPQFPAGFLQTNFPVKSVSSYHRQTLFGEEWFSSEKKGYGEHR